jgi:PilZ domain-containing protein
MEAEIPRVALLDDGELDDVRASLRSLGVAHCDARRATIGEAVPILLSTPTRARALADGCGEAPPHHLHAVIGSGAQASGAPCDLELLRPIESSVLRLLTRRHDIAATRERRLSTRVALGTSVGVSVGDDRREVTVSRISIGGCGLISPALLRTGARIEIELPPELSAPRRLQLRGEVLGSREVATGDGHAFDVSVAFRSLDLVDRVTLRALMARHAIDFRPATEGSSHRGDRGLRERALPPSLNRRRALRRRFQQRVMGVHDGLAHVLLARDLSRGGMRIEWNERLSVGDSLKIAVFGALDTAPLLAPAVVERNDDADGWFLRFDALDPAVEDRLGTLIDSLAPLDLDR